MIASVDLIEPRRRRLTRWIGAATLISAIHVAGGSLAMLHWQEMLVEESPGAIVVEIAPVAATLAVATLDLPPGPLTDDAEASQAASDPKLEKTEQAPTEDLPSPAIEPAVTLQKKSEETPKEEATEKPSPQVDTTQQQVAATKAAPTHVNAETSTKSAAPAVGTSTANSRSVVTWHNAVVLHLNRHKRYPASARMQNMQGIVHVRFSMDRGGQLTASQVVRSSGFPLLDEEVIELLKRAAPLPRPPLGLSGELLELIVPVKFQF
jgi:periplasmic protein TonB